jgi:hypothetical protein
MRYGSFAQICNFQQLLVVSKNSSTQSQEHKAKISKCAAWINQMVFSHVTTPLITTATRWCVPYCSAQRLYYGRIPENSLKKQLKEEHKANHHLREFSKCASWINQMVLFSHVTTHHDRHQMGLFCAETMDEFRKNVRRNSSSFRKNTKRANHYHLREISKCAP